MSNGDFITCSSPYSSAIGSFSVGFSPIDLTPAAPPPTGPIIKSFVYWEYSDDDDLQAFVGAYNTLTQGYSNWFASLNLPFYPGLAGAYLDWVGNGVYGLGRPALGAGVSSVVGPFNTYSFDEIGFNESYTVYPSNYTLVTDDIYKRILTWHLYKGDGWTFSISWLKRRIMRFLSGLCGIDSGIGQANRISVTFGVGYQINIRLLTDWAYVTGASDFNGMGFNDWGFNGATVTRRRIGDQFALGEILREAIEQGVLALPFQYTYVVQAGDPVSFLVPAGIRGSS